MFRRSGSNTARGVSACRGSGRRETYLDGQGGLSYTSIAQHHQLVQRHFARHFGYYLGQRGLEGRACRTYQSPVTSQGKRGVRSARKGIGSRGKRKSGHFPMERGREGGRGRGRGRGEEGNVRKAGTKWREGLAKGNLLRYNAKMEFRGIGIGITEMGKREFGISHPCLFSLFFS